MATAVDIAKWVKKGDQPFSSTSKTNTVGVANWALQKPASSQQQVFDNLNGYVTKIQGTDWKSNYDYDLLDFEDVERQQIGKMPKSLEKKYDQANPIDQWLFQNDLPPSAELPKLADRANRDYAKKSTQEWSKVGDFLRGEFDNQRVQSFKRDATIKADENGGDVSGAMDELLKDPKNADVLQNFYKENSPIPFGNPNEMETAGRAKLAQYNGKPFVAADYLQKEYDQQNTNAAAAEPHIKLNDYLQKRYAEYKSDYRTIAEEEQYTKDVYSAIGEYVASSKDKDANTIRAELSNYGVSSLDADNIMKRNGIKVNDKDALNNYWQAVGYKKYEAQNAERVAKGEAPLPIPASYDEMNTYQQGLVQRDAAMDAQNFYEGSWSDYRAIRNIPSMAFMSIMSALNAIPLYTGFAGNKISNAITGNDAFENNGTMYAWAKRNQDTIKQSYAQVEADNKIVQFVATGLSELVSMYAMAGAGKLLSTAAKGVAGASEIMVAQKAIPAYAKIAATTIAKGSPFVLRSASSNYQHAIDMGATDEQAIRYGAITGIVEGAVEAVGADLIINRTLGKFVTKALAKINMNAAVKAVITKGGAKLIEFLSVGFGEGAEELSTYYFNGAMEKTSFNHDWTPDAKEAAITFLSGAFVGFLGGGLSSAQESLSYQKASEILETVDTSPESINTLASIMAVESSGVQVSEEAMSEAKELTPSERQKLTAERIELENEAIPQEDAKVNSYAAEVALTNAEIDANLQRLELAQSEGDLDLMGEAYDELTKLEKQRSVAMENGKEAAKNFEIEQTKAQQKKSARMGEIESSQFNHDKAVYQKSVQAANVQPDGSSSVHGSVEIASTQEFNQAVGADPKIQPKRSLQEAVETLSKELGIPIENKRFARSQRNAAGYFMVDSEVAKTRVANDIQTVAHEVGHYLDKQYSLQSDPSVLAMVNNLTPEAKQSYAKGQWKAEAIAEFTRRYMLNPESARAFGGQFYDVFESKLDVKDKLALQNARNDFVGWYNLSGKEKLTSVIKRVDDKSKEKASDAFNNAVKKAEIALYDTKAPFLWLKREAEKELGRPLKPSEDFYVLASLSAYADGIANRINQEGLISRKGERLDSESYAKVTQDMSKEDYELLGAYLVAKRGQWLKQQRSIQPFSSYISDEEVAQVIADVEQNNPEIAEKANKIREIHQNFMREWAVGSGFLESEAFDEMVQNDPYYVPFRRVMDDKSWIGRKKGYNDQSLGIMRIRGSERNIIDPIASMAQETNKIVNAVKRNEVMLSLHKLDQKKLGLGEFMSKTEPDLKVSQVNIEKQKEAFAKAVEENVENADGATALLDQIFNDTVTQYSTKTVSDDKRVVGLVDEQGKRHYYEIRDPYLLEAVTALGESPELGTALSAFNKATNFMKRAITQHNPLFWITNFMRDTGEAFVYGSENNPLKFFAEQFKAVGRTLNKNETDLIKKYYDIGGSAEYGMTDEKRIYNDLLLGNMKGKNAFVKAGHWAKAATEHLNDAFEVSTREAEFERVYKKSKAEGMSDYDAQLLALFRSNDVTLDFRRRGKWSKQLDPLIMFYNVTMQSTYKAVRFAGDAKVRTKWLVKSLVGLAGLSIMKELLYRSGIFGEKITSAYLEVPKAIRDDYLLIPSSNDGTFIRIPMPNGLWAKLLCGSARRFTDAILGGEKAFDGFCAELFKESVPMSLVMMPAIQTMFNFKWTSEGENIIPIDTPADMKLQASERYDENTTYPAKVIGEWLNYSPKRIDYFVQQVMGGWAQIGQPLFAGGNVLDVAKQRFTTDTAYSNQNNSDYYDNKDELDKLQNTLEERGKADGFEKLTEAEARSVARRIDNFNDSFTDADKKIKAFRDRMKKIQDGEGTQAQKNKELREVRLDIVEVQREQNDKVKKFKEQLKKYGYKGG